MPSTEILSYTISSIVIRITFWHVIVHVVFSITRFIVECDMGGKVLKSAYIAHKTRMKVGTNVSGGSRISQKEGSYSLFGKDFAEKFLKMKEIGPRGP